MTHGRPTPQPATTERPRFRDAPLGDYANAEANPFLVSHRAYGRPLLPADEAWRWRDRWAEEIGQEGELHVELGSGNGFFLAELARRMPTALVIGVEIRFKRCVLCARKLQAAGVTNARILRYHAAFLDDLFEDGTLAALYVNHPDPWPKERHEKNRLISRWFLEDVARLLRPGGAFRLKSDHLPNIERALELLDRGPEGESLPPLPLQLVGRAEDVTRGPAPWPDDIETNYQRKFRERGLPVYALELRRTP